MIVTLDLSFLPRIKYGEESHLEIASGLVPRNDRWTITTYDRGYWVNEELRKYKGRG